MRKCTILLSVLLTVSFITGCVSFSEGVDITQDETEIIQSENVPFVSTYAVEATQDKELVIVSITTTFEETEYILNTNSMKFHYPTCGSGRLISEKNIEYYCGAREELIQMGYSPCGNCDP